MKPVLFQKLHPNAKEPTYGSPDAIGADLYALENTFVHQGAQAVIRTGVAIEIPPGYYGRIAPRSGLAVKYGIDVLAGVVDSDYRGEITAVLIYHGKLPRHFIKAGERIAQLILERADRAVFIETKNLGETVRGQGAFGSTGA